MVLAALKLLRLLLHFVFIPINWIATPFRVWAWTTRWRFIRGVLLEILTVLDTLMVGVYIQNGALLRTQRLFGRGNFLFGKALMVVSHADAAAAIVRPQARGSLFMGLPIVAFAPGALATNAAPTAVSQPARRVLREHMDVHVLTPERQQQGLGRLRDRCAHVLDEWARDPDRDTQWSLRGAVTRVLSIVLADIDIPKAQADEITGHYIRRFAEYSAFAYFVPFVLGLLATDDKVREQVYMPLRRMGMNPLVIDMVLFAGMFSVGTITMKCVENLAEYDIDYSKLSEAERMAFVTESLRLWPTVSTVHRLVEEPEQVVVGRRTITIRPGQEIAYPLVCINRDPSVFKDPEAFRLDRPREEVDQILSWSRGMHGCPAKHISVAVTVLMLDTLAGAAGDLRKLKIANFEV
jgi:cytochrome P450